jgi:hypothetical protein
LRVNSSFRHHPTQETTMTTDAPIACSLSADELPKRLAEMRAIGNDALVSVSPEGTLRFRADQPTRERLEAIITAESRCCSFLCFELTEERGELILAVTAAEAAEPLALELVSAFATDGKAA